MTLVPPKKKDVASVESYAQAAISNYVSAKQDDVVATKPATHVKALSFSRYKDHKMAVPTDKVSWQVRLQKSFHV